MVFPMTPVGTFCVAADHPSLPGHFPGNPVVPGVVLLDEAIFLMEAHAGRAVLGVPVAKFLAVVLPGQQVAVSCGEGRERIDFVCSVAGSPVARGAMQFARA